jgi:hypothetical protein
MWDGEFCGAINLRWRPGTGELVEQFRKPTVHGGAESLRYRIRLTS